MLNEENIEETKTNKLGITFTIDVPKSARDSKINTIVMLLHELKIIEEDGIWEESKLRNINKIIDDLKVELETLKYMEVEQ